MKFNSLSLESVYTAIKQAHGNPSTPPPLPLRRSPIYIQFRNAYKDLIKRVDGQRAVYLWYAIHDGQDPAYNYAGMSDKNIGGLRQRFDDEFRQWYHVYWMTAFKSDRHIQDVKNNYPGYDRVIDNQTLKRGATHVVYCTGLPANVNIPILEKEIIAAYDFPPGNYDEAGFMKPARLSDLAEEIVAKFDKIINETSYYSL